ncbi:Mss4-like protein [Sporodiniella umbellata]|nr:Mss4-like protein [Sporodiniella umbellata]
MSNAVAFKEINSPLETLVDPVTKKNLADIYCPKQGCSCFILRKNSGTLVERDGKNLLLPEGALNEDVEEQGVETHYWSVDNVMGFENLGFSKTVNAIKYLSCADCDLGPLGYHVINQKPEEYLLSIKRARYRLA